MSGGINSAAEDALQRAKELAAVDTSSNTSLKRSLEDDLDHQPAKKANLSTMDGSGIVQMGAAYMQMGMGESVVEVISIPDNTVGLVIGRGGTEIQNIQAQSQCRVQMSPESEPGTGVRNCTLQGTKMSVERAKQMINDVISRANQRQQGGAMTQSFGGGGDSGRSITVEMLIPATKCGLVIGKQGDTIKQLQEQAGCKMIMIQDSQEVTGNPKPLRITGEPEKIELAKRLVNDLLNSRDDNGGGGGGATPHQRFAHEGATAKGEVVVPRSSVGMIIGKGGETIKRLAMETGTKIQFKPDEDPTSPDRCAVIMGTREQIYKATELITELVHKSCNGGGGSGGGGGAGGGGATEVFYMHVPANKTGLVIGKGGETIKQINSESGAHCELSRDPPPNSQEKVFIIKGTAYQIHHAQHIIRIKVGDLAPGTPVPPFAGAQIGGPAGYGGAQFSGQFGHMQQNQWSAGFAQPDPANGWSGQQFYGAPAGAPAGAAFAAQYQQPGAQQQFTPAAAQPAAPGAPQSGGAPGINPQTGQPDYSAQWAEYYRSMGMHEQAAMIENQMKQNQAAAAARGASTTPASAGATPGAATAAPGTVAAPNAVYGGAYAAAAGQAQQFPQTGQFSAQPQQF